jgi:hypothetical protein
MTVSPTIDFLLAYLIVAITAMVLIRMGQKQLGHRRRTRQESSGMDTSIGDDNVFVGRVPQNAGDRNVIIDPGKGDLRIGGGTSIGYGAEADSTSVAIGAYAGGGAKPANWEESSNRGPVVRLRWWKSPWLVTVVGGALAGILTAAVIALLHIS